MSSVKLNDIKFETLKALSVGCARGVPILLSVALALLLVEAEPAQSKLIISAIVISSVLSIVLRCGADMFLVLRYSAKSSRHRARAVTIWIVTCIVNCAVSTLALLGMSIFFLTEVLLLIAIISLIITCNSISIVLLAHEKSGIFSLAFKSLSLNLALVFALMQGHNFFFYLVISFLFEIAIAYFLLRNLFFKVVSYDHFKPAYLVKRYRAFLAIISCRKELILLAPLTYLSQNIITVMAFFPGEMITAAFGNLIQRCIGISSVAIQIVSFSYIRVLKFNFSPFKCFLLFLVFGGLLLGFRLMTPVNIAPIFVTAIEVSIACCMAFAASLARLFYESHDKLSVAVFFLLMQILLTVIFSLGINYLFPFYKSTVLDSFLIASLFSLVLTVVPDCKLSKKFLGA